MRHLLRPTALCLALAMTDPVTAAPAADTLYLNARVYTADAARTEASAVAIQGNTIAYVGDEKGAADWRGPGTRVVDLGGKLVLPGLIDAHVHALGVVQPDVCDLKSQGMSLAVMVDFLRACLAGHPLPAGEWMMVPQWNFSMGNEPDARYPTLRAALDAVSTEHPIMLRGNDGHHGAANSLALSRARGPDGTVIGYSRQTLAKEFSDIRALVAVDAAGEPSGGITEGAKGRLGAPGFFGTDDFTDVVPKAAQVFREQGITSILDAAVDPSQLVFWRGLEDKGGMTFRMRAGLIRRFDDPSARPTQAQIPEVVKEFVSAREQMERESRLIRASHVKMFVDGVLEGNPYADPPTLPNGAVLKPYLQPRFAGTPGGEDFHVSGYVDPADPACAQAPAARMDHPATERFRDAHGFDPAQCLQSSGVLEQTVEYLHAYESAMARAGFAVHTHAIGDRSVRVAIGMLEEAKRLNPDAQHSMAHAQLISPEDQVRIGKAGLGVVFTHAWTVVNPPYDFSVIPFFERIDGKDLYRDGYYMRNVYPTAAIARLGGIVASGSDAPVEERNPRPFHNLEQALTRANPDPAIPGVLNAAERLDIHQAIASYTINAARVLGMEKEIGSIEPGKKADLIVVDQDVLALAAHGEERKIGDTRVLRTIFDGREVFSRE